MTIANNVAAKLTVAFVASAMLFSLVFAPVANAQTTAELQAQIQALLSQIATLQAQVGGGATSGASCSTTFTRDLSTGSTGADVMALQQFLNSDPETRVAASGVGSAGMETQTYGPLTAAAVSKFQVKYRAEILTPAGLVNPTGYFGPSTRAKVNALCAAAPAPGTPSTPSTGLEGGAGSINYKLMTSLRDEEVGERQNNVEVAGLEAEARGSDVEVSAVRLVFAQGTADRPFDRYASEVSVWLDGERYARVNASEFNRNNDYSRTVTLNSGAVIRENRTGELVVAVSGASAIDSDDITETWTVDFTSVRYRDAQGVTISEDPGTAPRTFSFESFASAANTELRLRAGDDAVNKARVIELNESSRTNGVELLSFEMEARGNSDIEIFELPVAFVSTGTDLDDMITSVYLMADGSQIGSESMDVSSTTGTITFEDLDYVIRAGRTVDFVVTADFRSTTAGANNGDTVLARIQTAQRDAIDAEDESGTLLADGDKSGTAVGEAHGLFDEGIRATFVSASHTKTSSTESGVPESVEFTLVFDVTAFGNEMTVADVCEVGAASATSTRVGVDNNIASNDVECVDIDSTGTDVGNGFQVREGTTERFTVTVLAIADQATFTPRARLNGIAYGAGNNATPNTQYAFNLTDFRSSAVTIFNR